VPVACVTGRRSHFIHLRALAFERAPHRGGPGSRARWPRAVLGEGGSLGNARRYAVTWPRRCARVVSGNLPASLRTCEGP
jgi:hypothetical protein